MEQDEILELLGIKLEDIDRERGIYEEEVWEIEEEDIEVEFLKTLDKDQFDYFKIRTRTGGHNTAHYIISNIKLAQNPYCIGFFGDNYDNTYMNFIFAVKKELEAKKSE